MKEENVMKKFIQTLIIIVCLIHYFPAGAEQVRQLSWEDLIPEEVLSINPLETLTQDQKDLIYWIVNTKETLPARGPETEDLYKEIDKARADLRKSGLDMDMVISKIKRILTATDEELNGKRVRIPGYLLPLEVSGTKVTEFLLVPYVGACIHVPPPPPNQIVHVEIVKKKGYKNKKLYEPVWVTGVISAQSMVKDLYLTDGSAGIDIGYKMQAYKIEPYKK